VLLAAHALGVTGVKRNSLQNLFDKCREALMSRERVNLTPQRQVISDQLQAALAERATAHPQAALTYKVCTQAHASLMLGKIVVQSSLLHRTSATSPCCKLPTVPCSADVI
jgi:hypothetical protein